MNLELSGKLALVTGGSAGIGKAIARCLAEEGCRVVINGRDPQRLHDAADELGVVQAICADVSTEAGAAVVAREIAKTHGSLDVLVCNVGSGKSKAGMTEAADDWQRMLSLNLLSSVYMVRAAMELLTRAQGSIVCVSSICGVEALGCPLAYGSAKAALNSYVRSASRTLAKAGVRINAVAPGNVMFAGSTWETKMRDAPDAVAEMLRRDVALGRLGHADEIASCVAFLASARASFVTGEVMIADGGQVKS